MVNSGNLKFNKKIQVYFEKILSKYLDEKLVNMPKMGFDIPLLNWIKPKN